MLSSAQHNLEQGHAYLQSFDFYNAEKSYKESIQQMPSSTEALLAMARLQLLKGNSQGARLFAKRALQIESTPQAYALLGACSLQENDIQEALHILQKASLLYPTNPFVLTNLGKALYQSGLYNEAKQAIMTAQLYGALADEVSFDLGLICEELELLEDAQKHYMESIEANPTFLPSYLRLSRIATTQNNVAKAISWLEKGSQEMPDLIQIKEELYGLYFLNQEPQKAMNVAVQMAKQRGCAADYLRIGNTCLYLNQMEEARTAYEHASYAEPNNIHAYINLGHWHRIHHNKDEAIDAYCVAIDKDETSYKPYLGLALLFIELDQNFKKARYFLLQAIERKADDFDVLMHLTLCSMYLEKWEEAYSVAQDARALCSTPEEIERVEENIQRCQQALRANG